MNKIGVVEAKSEWDISSEELLIRVTLGNNQEINLIFPHNVVDDTFFNHSCKDREEAKKKVIKTLQTMDNLLNCLTQEALKDEEVQEQLKKKEIGQFTVTYNHFFSHMNSNNIPIFKDYR